MVGKVMGDFGQGDVGRAVDHRVPLSQAVVAGGVLGMSRQGKKGLFGGGYLIAGCPRMSLASEGTSG
jgi:hypothetical protein